MTIEKSEIKMLTMRDIGIKLDDALEAAKLEHANLMGAKSALNEAARKIDQHQGSVDKDRDEGLLDMETIKIAKKYVQQCAGILRNLAINAEIRAYQVQGKTQGLELAVKVAKELHDRERGKVEAYKEAAKRGVLLEDNRGRPVGVHPGASLAAKRKLELVQNENPVAQTEIASSGQTNEAKNEPSNASEVIPELSVEKAPEEKAVDRVEIPPPDTTEKAVQTTEIPVNVAIVEKPKRAKKKDA